MKWIRARFEANLIDKRILLEWSTVMEVNNQFFTIERSINGVDWDEIGKVKANNSLFLNKYYFEDGSSCEDYNYYRLSQTDFDGKITYLGLRSVKCNEKSEVEYYNLQGVKVNIDEVPSGIYVKKMNNNYYKVIK